MKYDFSAENLALRESKGAREAFGEALLAAARENENILAISADVKNSTKVNKMQAEFPDRVYNVGIAEQNLIGVAAGLSRAGYTVFASSFASFIAYRAYEQIKVDGCYQNHNIKMASLTAGFGFGMQGNTHYALEDLALMRSLPNLTVFSPSDASCIFKAVEAAAKIEGPVYLRITGEGPLPTIYTEDYEFEVGKANYLMRGDEVTIIATGAVTCEAYAAGKMLEEEGISVTVLDMHTIKPFDKKAVVDAAGSKLIVTVEEHSRIGGLGSAVAEALAEAGKAANYLPIGTPDIFGPIGDYDCQKDRYGLSAAKIAEAVKNALK